MEKVLCFGELLLRISPFMLDANQDSFSIFLGGAEANVATALAGWNIPVRYCTVLPDNFMSQYVINYLSVKHIETSAIRLSGNRIGLYYLETGADIKGGVVYDREQSSFSELVPGVIDWEQVFEGVDWFHFTAISPALNQSIADVCLEALQVASRKGLKISVDLNYRSKLWKYGKDPKEIMPQLVSYCNLIMGNIWSANSLLGIDVAEDIHQHQSKQAYLAHAEKTSKAIMQQFSKCEAVANTYRFDSNDEQILYYTTLQLKDTAYSSQEFSCTGVVDRSGSGDCFMAGLIYGFITNPDDPQELLNYATAAAFGKLQEQGDATEQEILQVESGFEK